MKNKEKRDTLDIPHSHEPGNPTKPEIPGGAISTVLDEATHKRAKKSCLACEFLWFEPESVPENFAQIYSKYKQIFQTFCK